MDSVKSVIRKFMVLTIERRLQVIEAAFRLILVYRSVNFLECDIQRNAYCIVLTSVVASCIVLVSELVVVVE